MSWLLSVMYWPSRPAIMASWKLPKLGWMVAVVHQPPVVDHQHQVAVDLRRLALVDDQHAVEPARQLLRGAEMGVVPERAGIGRREVVVEALARLDRLLRQIRHAVHGIGQPQPVPMHHRRLVEIVDQPDFQFFALLDPQRRARAHAVIAPDRGRRRVACRAAAPRPDAHAGRGSRRPRFPAPNERRPAAAMARHELAPAPASSRRRLIGQGEIDARAVHGHGWSLCCVV